MVRWNGVGSDELNWFWWCGNGEVEVVVVMVVGEGSAMWNG